MSYCHSLEGATARSKDEAHPRGSPDARLAPPHSFIVLNCYVYLCLLLEDPATCVVDEVLYRGSPKTGPSSPFPFEVYYY